MLTRTVILAAVVTMAVSNAAVARDQIRIVGSSTVFPFSTAVAEQFGKITSFKTPVVESTGTGGGIKLFCAGLGVDHPDISNASRRIKISEVENCAKNGVGDITEVKFGYDGIVMANSKAAAQIEIGLRHIFLALAKDVPADDNGESLIPNPYTKWSEIAPSLPDRKIEVLGPPPTSGTRDAFAELALEGGCQTFPALSALQKADKGKYKAICHGVREDGAWIEAGENDVLIVQKLVANPDAFGVFGFSFLDQNTDRIHASLVDGVEPTFEAISDGDYAVSRSLYFYVKKAHAEVIPGVADFVAEFTSEAAWGPDGYLTDKGLIPMPDAEREQVNQSANAMAPLAL